MLCLSPASGILSCEGRVETVISGSVVRSGDAAGGGIDDARSGVPTSCETSGDGATGFCRVEGKTDGLCDSMDCAAIGRSDLASGASCGSDEIWSAVDGSCGPFGLGSAKLSACVPFSGSRFGAESGTTSEVAKESSTASDGCCGACASPSCCNIRRKVRQDAAVPAGAAGWGGTLAGRAAPVAGPAVKGM